METKADQGINANFLKHIIITSAKYFCITINIAQQMYAEDYYYNQIFSLERFADDIIVKHVLKEKTFRLINLPKESLDHNHPHIPLKPHAGKDTCRQLIPVYSHAI